jgi:hypothetical protein
VKDLAELAAFIVGAAVGVLLACLLELATPTPPRRRPS